MLVVAVLVPVAPGAITWLGAVAGLLLVQAWFVRLGRRLRR